MEKIIIGIAAAAFILFIFLAEYLRQKKYFSSVDDNVLYVMKPSPIWLCYGVIAIIGFAVPVTLFLIHLDERALAGFAVFYCFELLGVYMCIYGLLYRCVITTDSLIIYTPFLPVKKIAAQEITNVKFKKKADGVTGREICTLEIYLRQKKICSIDDDTKGFDLLYFLFDQNGMIDRTPIVENICVTAQKSEKIMAVIVFLFLLILWIIMTWNNEFTLFHHILMLICMSFILSTGAHAFLWRVTMDSHTLSVRNSFGKIKTYELRQITKVERTDEHIILYTGQKQIVRIPKKAKNSDYLAVRLGSIPHLSYPSDK